MNKQAANVRNLFFLISCFFSACIWFSIYLFIEHQFLDIIATSLIVLFLSLPAFMFMKESIRIHIDHSR